jgi:hypothetical protein
MMAAGGLIINVGWAWLVVGVVLTGLGVWGLIAGRRGRRRGLSPHCARCNYNLHGTDRDRPDARCPECGAELRDPRAVRVGRRVARPVALLLGTFVLAIGLLIIAMLTVRAVNRVNWYQFKSTSTLLTDAGSNDEMPALRAIHELNRRFLADGLTADETVQFVDALLAVRDRPQVGRYLQTTVNLLSAVWKRDAFTQEQRERYIAGAQQVELRARPRVPSSHPIPLQVCSESHMAPPLLVRGRVASLRVDDAPLPSPDQKWMTYVPFTARDVGFTIPPLPPGEHTVTVEVVTDLLRVLEDEKRVDETPIDTRDRTLRVTFEVLADTPPDLVRTVRSAALDASMQSLCGAERFSAYARHRDTASPGLSLFVSGTIHVAAAPACDAAFDVVLVWDDRQHRLDRLVLRSTDPSFGWSHQVEGPVPDDIPDNVSVRLVASVPAALETADVTEIWGGTLDVGGVLIEGLDKARDIQRRYPTTQTTSEE